VLAIRVATKWFADHLKANSSVENIDVIMLSDDRGNREKAKATGIKSCGGN
jgi:exosome complex exonuclease DIS3/RRP44